MGIGTLRRNYQALGEQKSSPELEKTANSPKTQNKAILGVLDDKTCASIPKTKNRARQRQATALKAN